MIEKALTLTQPWATLVMLGEKRVETRRLLYKHRGRLWIHAARGFWPWDPAGPFGVALGRHGITEPGQLPLGAVLGSVDVIDGCHFDGDRFPACMPIIWWPQLGQFEHAFGDFSPGRGGLLLANRAPLETPVKARGMNGLWNWETEVRA